MTSRERVNTALNHKVPDKVPFAWGFGVNERAKADLGKYLHKTPNQVNRIIWAASDLRFVCPKYIGPPELSPFSFWTDDKPDMWGVKYKKVFNGFDYYFEFAEYPLKGLGDTKSLKDHRLPSPDWFDYSVIPRQIKIAEESGGDEYAFVLGKGSPFEFSWYMVGFEDFLALLVTDPDIAYELMEKVNDFFIEYLTRGLEAGRGRIDIGFTADDMAHQRGPLISLDLWKKMVKPHHVKMNNALHKCGVKILYHSCGTVMYAVDQICDMGVDILESLQFNAEGMDPAILKTQFGDTMCFHGGVSVQETLPHGTPAQVKAETRERIEVLGRNGGYILAPSHAIQGGTPPENIIAMMEEADRFYPDQIDEPLNINTYIS
jgi:uroporphyrinogen decarboxylase